MTEFSVLGELSL